ncbi:MAG: hypothetical protein ACRCYY_21920 [Trueperaceae bacterium]
MLISMKSYSAKDIAELASMTRQNVTVLAKKHGKGTVIGGGQENQYRVFSEADLKWFMKERKPGPVAKKKKVKTL